MLIIACAKVSISWCKVTQSLVHKLDVETGNVYFPIGYLQILFSSSRGDFFYLYTYQHSFIAAINKTDDPKVV